MSPNLFNFENLEVYQKSVNFNKKIFGLTKGWPKEYLFDLTSQIRRASLSISLNIAEGSSRKPTDFKHFLGISRGSCYEIIPILEIVLNEKLISQNLKEELYQEVCILARMISSLRNSITAN